MRISFIIPHKGREELLEQTVQSILDLDFNSAQIEIIIVTQNKSLENNLLKHNASQVTIIFQPDHTTIAASRNAGARVASGEYLAFLDADIELSRNWLTVMFDELAAQPERVLISAVQESSPHAGGVEKARVALSHASADNEVEFLGTANLFMNRTVFEVVGGFPEKMITCEDYYFTSNVNRIGKLYLTSRASFIHLGEDKNYTELFRKEIWRGQSNFQSLQGRKISLRELPSLLTPLWQTCFACTTLLSLLIGKPMIALFSSAMVCIPVILYAMRLYRSDRKKIGFVNSVCFYGVYQFSRIIGTMKGFSMKRVVAQ